MKHSRQHFGAGLLAVVLMFGLTATAAGLQGERADDAIRRANKASSVIKAIMGAPDKGIPAELLQRAEAVVVCPEVLKAALGIGGRRGQCVVSRRMADGWSTPVYYNLNGASFGPQIGGEKLDLILLVMNKDGVNGLLEDKFEMGGEAGVTAAGGAHRERIHQRHARRGYPILLAQQRRFHRGRAQGCGHHARQRSQSGLLWQEGQRVTG